MKNRHVFRLLLVMGFAFIIFGTSYAIFTYHKTGANQKIIAGDISMSFDDNIDSINLIGIFPEKASEARLKDDNYVTFNISGTNTSNKDIYYEVDLIYGDEEDLIRFDDKDLRFDLVEVNGSNETIIMDSVSFTEINNSKIWVETIDGGTTSYDKTFKLRMWLDGNVLISDTNPNATYSASTYKNHYASVKVKVIGDFDEKHLYNVMGNFPSVINSQKQNVTEVYFINEKQNVINERYNAATIKADVTNTSHSVGTQKLKDLTDYGKVLAWLEDDTNNTGKYILYVGSDGPTYLSVGDRLFGGNGTSDGWINLTLVDMLNVNAQFMKGADGMFNYAGYNANSFTVIGLNNCDTRNVTNMASMFSYAGYSATTFSVDLSDLDTSSVTNMSYMFRCAGYNAQTINLDLSGWDTSSVTNMTYMFYSFGKNIQTINLDLSDFDTSSVTNMTYMFGFAEKIQTIYVGNKWSTASVTESSYMFYRCNSLVGGNGTSKRDNTIIDASYAHVDAPGNPGYLTLKS